MRQLIVTVAVPALLFISNFSHGQENRIKEAEKLTAQQKFTEAINIYNAMLAENPQHLNAKIGRGFTWSWMHEFDKAKADLYAVLQQDPGNIHARKGLAYVALWSDDNKSAVRQFDELILTYPGIKEFYIARGMAQLNDGQLKAARASFEKAKQLDLSDPEPQQLIDAVRTKPAILNIDVIGGISSSDNESKGGLRMARISSQVSKQMQLAVKYDNSLSLDNRSLILSNQTIPYYSGSVFYQWSKQTATCFEGGARKYSDPKPGEVTRETQFSLEQIFFLKNNKSVKIGGSLITPDKGENAFLFTGSYHQPLSKQFSGGMTYFFANRNIFNTTENRFLIDADYYIGHGHVINGGFYYGKSSSDAPQLDGNIYGGFLKGHFPVGNQLGIHVMLAAENNFIQNLFNAGAGIRFRLEK